MPIVVYQLLALLRRTDLSTLMTVLNASGKMAVRAAHGAAHGVSGAYGAIKETVQRPPPPLQLTEGASGSGRPRATRQSEDTKMAKNKLQQTKSTGRRLSNETAKTRNRRKQLGEIVDTNGNVSKKSRGQ